MEGIKIEDEITRISDQIKIEKNLFKTLSLYGKYNVIKMATLYPGLKSALFLKKLKIIFENFYNNINNDKLPKFVKKNNAKINDNFPLEKLIDNLSLNEQEKKLIISFILINKTNATILAILCTMKQQINLIFEYDDDISFHFINNLFNISELIKTKKKDILYIKYIKNDFNYDFIKSNENIDFAKLNEFEIYGISVNGDKKSNKIIDIKDYLNNFNNNMMDEELELKFKNIQYQLQEQRGIIIKQSNEINSLKEKDSQKSEEINSLKEKDSQKSDEIKTLKNKIIDLENKYNNIKGRFIFKAFADYLFILFNINVKLKNKKKKKILKFKIEKAGCDSSYIIPIIKLMKYLYRNLTEESHYIPTNKEIKTTILSQYNNNDKDEYSFILNLFKRLNPESIIKKIILKNNELTKLLISRSSSENKNLQKSLIIKEINAIISDDDKEKSILIIKEIINEDKNNKDNDENDEEEENEYDDYGYDEEY